MLFNAFCILQPKCHYPILYSICLWYTEEAVQNIISRFCDSVLRTEGILLFYVFHTFQDFFKVKIPNFREAPAALLLEKITQRGCEATIQPVH